ncbi:hypothetical protein [Phenylobacterium sp.]|jgi:hypothetical protein|uniref:hypothetical protein n=1 Tax=Phenylobacterium sp. TaxID=1871053 RepID=UPI002F94FF75
MNEPNLTMQTASGTAANLPPDLAKVAADWWYYGVELAPGVIMRGSFPTHLPLLFAASQDPARFRNVADDLRDTAHLRLDHAD